MLDEGKEYIMPRILPHCRFRCVYAYIHPEPFSNTPCSECAQASRREVQGKGSLQTLAHVWV